MSLMFRNDGDHISQGQISKVTVTANQKFEHEFYFCTITLFWHWPASLAPPEQAFKERPTHCVSNTVKEICEGLCETSNTNLIGPIRFLHGEQKRAILQYEDIIQRTRTY
jgi:hypothetical protein